MVEYCKYDIGFGLFLNKISVTAIYRFDFGILRQCGSFCFLFYHIVTVIFLGVRTQEREKARHAH
jgi:hypothetical protein